MPAYADGEPAAKIGEENNVPHPKVSRCTDRALRFGPATSSDGLPGKGKPPELTGGGRVRVIFPACRKPEEPGCSYEMRTAELLSEHVRKHCETAGPPSLPRIGRGTVPKILAGSKVRPRKIACYPERRDSESEEKTARVLCVCRQAESAQVVSLLNIS